MMSQILKDALKFIGLVVLLLSLSGCAGFGRKLKSFLGGKPTQTKQAKVSSAGRNGRSFSSSPHMMVGPSRQYKRMTKKKLSAQSAISERSGSLWVMEGQGAYLFSQNIIRMIGDSISVRINGDPKQQLESKVGVIKKLLANLRARRRRRKRGLAEAQAKEAKKDRKKKVANAPKQPSTKKTAEDRELDEAKFSVKRVPTRIIERLIDGNYRIKGGQTFLIGNREYKAIVTGIVKAEDFSEDGIDATQLMDSKFDIVSVRKRGRKL